MSTKTRVACGLIIFRRLSSGLEYLLLKASYGDFHWSPPKGHVDPGETEMQTALRETEEEAGFKAEQLNICEQLKAELNYEVRGKPKRVVYWLAELIDSNATVKLSSEHTDYKWLNFKDALVYAKYEDMKSALEKADQFIKDNQSS